MGRYDGMKIKPNLGKEKKYVNDRARRHFSDRTIKWFENEKVRVKTTNNPNVQKDLYSVHSLGSRNEFIDGFNFLQYNIVVKEYILRKHRIKNDKELDILLYLFPIQYFSRRDFSVLPIRYADYNIKILMELDYIKVHINKARKANIYRLTDRAMIAIIEYYRYLAGDEIFDPEKQGNPFRNEEKVKMDLKREKLLERLKKKAIFEPHKFNHGSLK